MLRYKNNAGIRAELKKAAIDKGIAQKEIAEKLGMIPQTYNSLINKKNLAFADVRRILDVLDMDLWIEFRSREEEEERQE